MYLIKNFIKEMQNKNILFYYLDTDPVSRNVNTGPITNRVESWPGTLGWILEQLV